MAATISAVLAIQSVPALHLLAAVSLCRPALRFGPARVQLGSQLRWSTFDLGPFIRDVSLHGNVFIFNLLGRDQLAESPGSLVGSDPQKEPVSLKH